MKKRSILALASLATGFVVAAVSPSHAADHARLGDLKVKDTLGAVDHTLTHEGLDVEEGTLGQSG
ncbi:hypothetical protein ACWEQU_02695 [Streptomyces nodosus]